MSQGSVNAAVTHTQPTDNPQAVWVIDHGLQTEQPVVDVYVKVDNVDTKVLPKEIRVLSTNTVQITFSSPQSGVAVIV
jgi:hypothetical protein